VLGIGANTVLLGLPESILAKTSVLASVGARAAYMILLVAWQLVPMFLLGNSEAKPA
jgi:hypothetical protein